MVVRLVSSAFISATTAMCWAFATTMEGRVHGAALPGDFAWQASPSMTPSQRWVTPLGARGISADLRAAKARACRHRLGKDDPAGKRNPDGANLDHSLRQIRNAAGNGSLTIRHWFPKSLAALKRLAPPRGEAGPRPKRATGRNNRALETLRQKQSRRHFAAPRQIDGAVPSPRAVAMTPRRGSGAGRSLVRRGPGC